MKRQYSSPTVVRLGRVVEKTEGGWVHEVVEILSWRAVKG
jgi:hypothetical protein